MKDEREERAKRLTEQMARERGFPRLWRSLLAQRDPEFMELYHKAAVHAVHERKALPRKFKEILLVCLDAMTFYEEGLRIHVRNALEAGATEDEIVEALEVCSLIGIHHLSIFLPPLVEEVEKYERERDQAEK